MKKEILFLAIGLVLACSTSNDEDLNTSVTEAASSQKLVDAKIRTVTIGTQEWMLENLNVSKYRNGDVIPKVTDRTAWFGLTTGAWCYYNNVTSNGRIYGKLYNWHAVKDPRGLAPEGFHIPTNGEWAILIDFLGGYAIAGDKMKATILWVSPNNNNNSSGFTALPGGYRDNYGDFSNIDYNGYWWSSTEYSTAEAWFRGLYYEADSYVRNDGYRKEAGFSVRCIKNQTP